MTIATAIVFRTQLLPTGSPLLRECPGSRYPTALHSQRACGLRDWQRWLQNQRDSPAVRLAGENPRCRPQLLREACVHHWHPRDQPGCLIPSLWSPSNREEQACWQPGSELNQKNPKPKTQNPNQNMNKITCQRKKIIRFLCSFAPLFLLFHHHNLLKPLSCHVWDCGVRSWVPDWEQQSHLLVLRPLEKLS